MTRQLRAVRTRQALVNAAATEFDRSGYTGAALNRVCRAAGITMGALTFHFSTKGELAAAVQAKGQTVTRAALGALPSGPAPALHRAIDMTLELARLLEEEPAVRSAARLSRELPDGDLAWMNSWVAAVQGPLQPGLSGRTVACRGPSGGSGHAVAVSDSRRRVPSPRGE